MKNVEDIYPLSPMQEGFLFHTLSAPGSGDYVEQAVWSFHRPWNQSAMMQAWRDAVARHAVLRSAFFWEGIASPRQVVRRTASLPWQDLDWSHHPASAVDGLLSALLDEDRRRGFTLQQAPLLRITAIRLPSGVRRFVFTYHHLLLDAWSVSLLLLEIFATYDSLDRGETPVTRAAPPYREFIAWLQQQDPTGAQAFWREALGNAQSRPLFQADSGPAGPARYFTCDLRLPGIERLKQFVRANSCTMSALVHTAWAMLVGRYTGSDDVLFGSVVAGRSAAVAGIDSMIGLLINAQPIRFAVPSARTCAEHLRAMQALQTSLRRFEHVPLKDIQKWRGLRAGPLFDSLVVFDQWRPHDTAGVQDFFHNQARTGYPVTLEAFAADDLRLQLTVDERHVDRHAARRLLGHCGRVIEALVTDGNASAGALSIVTPGEHHQLLIEWNDSAAEVPHDEPVHRLIEREVRRRPGATAVVAGNTRLSYHELNGLANRLARHLQRLGIGPECRVGVCAERSPELVWALVGILKCGAAYVPIDPDYPAHRRDLMLRDAEVSAVLCQQRFASLVGLAPVTCIVLESPCDDWDQLPETDVAVDMSMAHTAYAIYTSGSTGVPKAVLNTHGALVNRLWWMQQAYRLTDADRVLQKTPFSFDVSVWEFFWPLMTGAQLVLARPGGHRDPDYLIDCIVSNGITILHFVPSMLRAFLEAPGVGACRTLRDVFCSGEALPRDLERRFFERLGASLHNLYGPTEAAIDVTSWRCTADAARHSVPIGRPIANVAALVVDRDLQLAPIGVTGELCLAGTALARGYWRRPELTAEKFIPHPCGRLGGERLYRTGDLARMLPGGAIEYLGRADDLVKLRGVRIELGEIEAVLREHVDIGDAAVVVQDEARLVAYVVSANDAPPSVRRLRAFVEERLPAPMRPAAYLFVESLPMGPAGKLDRRALPLVATTRADEANTFVAPRSATEQRLADVWKQVLGVAEVSLADDFFALGGDSIVALRMVSAARQAGSTIGLLDVFECPTLEALAARQDSSNRATASDDRLDGQFPLAPIQEWFFAAERSDPHHFNQSVLIELAQPVDPGIVNEAVRRLEGHHDSLRLSFSRAQGNWAQSYQPAVDTAAARATTRRPPFSCVDWSALSHAGRSDALTQLQASLDLERGPLWRVTQLAPGLLLLIAHHLVIDIVSWQVLLDDLHTLLSSAVDAPLPAKTPSYGRWAEALGKIEISSHALPPWARAFRDGLRATALPRDFDGNNVESTARVVTVELPEQASARLIAAPRSAEPALLTGLGLALTGWLRAETVVVDVETHGRGPHPQLPDVSRTVGWFTSIVPVALPVGGRSPAEAFRDTTGARAKATADAVPRAVSGSEVLFNYAGELDRTARAWPFFRLSDRSPGQTRSPRDQRSHLIEINCGIARGRVVVQWTYGDRIHRQATIDDLAAAMIGHLEALLVDNAAEALNPLLLEHVSALSPMQAGMLFQSTQSAGPDVYFQQWTFVLDGDINQSALEQAWRTITARHDVLRTSCHWKDRDEALQVVHRSVAAGVLHGEATAASLGTFIDADRRRGFDLETAPLARLALFRTGARAHALVFSFHHVILDGWSAALLLEDLFFTYRACATGSAGPPRRHVQFREYLAWLARQNHERSERWWRDTLRGFTAPTPLTLDKGDAPDHQMSSCERRLSRQLTERVQQFARRQRLTVSSIVQGAWAILLARCANTADVLFGTVMSGRPADLDGADSMVGMLINTLPMRLRVGEDDTPESWLRDVQLQFAKAAEHAFVPLSKVRASSEVPAGTALFESIVIFENYPIDRTLAGLPGDLRVADFTILEQTDYPLMLVAAPGPELAFRLLFDAARFSAAAIDRLLAQLEHLIERLTSGDTACLRDLEILPVDERDWLLAGSNEVRIACPAGCLHELFEQRVAIAPGALAVIDGTIAVSYDQLNRRANRLARHLRTLGAGPERLVAVCVERSLEMVIAFLATLKAGAAWLPLDPEYPRERLQWMLDNADPVVLLTQESHRALLDAHRCHLVVVDSPLTSVPAEDGNLDALAADSNLAYVIYTSGSTGTPKGVMIAHRAMVNHSMACIAAYGFAAGDRVMQFGSMSFDNCVEELFPALLSGGTVVLRTPDMLTSAVGFLQAVERMRLSVLNLPTAFWHAWVDELAEAGAKVPRALRVMKVGGEEASSRHLGRWRDLGGEGICWLNGYGPTETAVTATFWRAGAVTPRRLPIGRPVANARTYVLDSSQRLLPIGAPGELYIGGFGVGRGYLKQPDLTAERFVPDPFSAEPGARMYRTGDLVRVISSGDLEYLGRIDNQIKIRGFRVELQEIELALTAHPAVAEAVVVAASEPGGGASLVAYVVSGAVNAADLRGHLGRVLPAYMMPRAFVLLDELPLNHNGKVDRQRLPAAPAFETGGDYTPPRNAVETLLATVWAEVLGRPRVGIHDNFFEIGGDSIVSLRIVARVAARGFALTPRLLFESPTVAELATHVTAIGQPAATLPTSRSQDADISDRDAERLATLLASRPQV